jgi:hypothetical protein
MNKRAILASVGLMALLAAAAGCLNPFRPLVQADGKAVSEEAPLPNSATGALQLLRWCWINREISKYEELFTDDFQFAFSDVEAADYAPVYRYDELQIARHLFVDGSATEPRVKRIDLDFSGTLVAIADQRPGKISPWHRQVTTGVVLRADLGDAIWDVHGDVTFYLVRGDSAQIPTDLRNLGFLPSPGRWYIERWEDHTDAKSGNGSAVVPVLTPLAVRRAMLTALAQGTAPRTTGIVPEIQGSWGELKQEYRPAAR